MSEATNDAPVLTKVQDSEKLLQAILDQLTIMSGVNARESSFKRDMERKKREQEKKEEKQFRKEFISAMKDNTAAVSKMREAAAGVTKARDKKGSKDINRKDRDKNVGDDITKQFEGKTYKEKMAFFKEKKKVLKQQSRIEKKILKHKERFERRQATKEKWKNAPGEGLEKMGRGFSPSNMLLALGPAGFLAKMVLDGTGWGGKIADSVKSRIPGMGKGKGFGGRDSDDLNKQMKGLKYERSLSKKLSKHGGSKTEYYKNAISGTKGLRVGERGNLEVDDSGIWSRLAGKPAETPDSTIPGAGGKGKGKNKRQIKETSRQLQTSTYTGKPTDKQMRSTWTGRPFLWFREVLEENGLLGRGRKGKGGKEKEGSGKSGLLKLLMALGLGALVGAVKGLATGTKKAISEKAGKTENGEKPKEAKKTSGGTKKERAAEKAKSQAAPEEKGKSGKGGWKSFGVWTGISAINNLLSGEGDVAETAVSGAAGAAAAATVQKGAEKFAHRTVGKILGFASNAILAPLGQVLMAKESVDLLYNIGEKQQELRFKKQTDAYEKKIKNDPEAMARWASMSVAERIRQSTPATIANQNNDNRLGAPEGSKLANMQAAADAKRGEKAAEAKKAVRDEKLRAILYELYGPVALYRPSNSQITTAEYVLKKQNEYEAEKEKYGEAGASSKLTDLNRVKAENKSWSGSSIGSLFDSSNIYRQLSRDREANRQAEAAKPKKANDLLTGKGGNYTFNSRDKHYALANGQVLSTNRGIQTLPESQGIKENRFASGSGGNGDDVERLLTQILSELKSGGGRNAAVINNTTKLINPESFSTGGVFV